MAAKFGWLAFRAARQEAPLSVEEYFLKLARKGLHPDGSPVLDPTPMAPPIGYKKHPSMVEVVRAMVQGERLKAAAEAAGAETFEESEDFEVGDDYEEQLRSQWENEYDPPLSVLVAAGREAIAEKAREAADKASEVGGAGGTPPAGGAASAVPKAP